MKSELSLKSLHCDLKEEILGMVSPELEGYDKIIIRCEKYMTKVEVHASKKKGFTEICDILERRGILDIGKYNILRELFKDINEPAIKVIDKYQTKIDELKLREEATHSNQIIQTDEISSGILKSWMEDDKFFCSTKATEDIYIQAEIKRKVLVCGVSGIGKSANVHHIALKLKDKGYRMFRVQRIKEMVESIDKLGEDKQVYVFDDVFGVHGVDEDKRRDWSDENKDTLEYCLKKPNVIILCTSRLTVIKDDKLSSIKSHFTIINLSQGEHELTDDEKVEIFRKHATAKERDDLLNDEVKQKIKTVNCPLGCFPFVCRLYTGDKETTQTIEEYFNKPLKELAYNLCNLQIEEPVRHFCLLMCLIYENKLLVNTISVGDESEQTEKLRRELLEVCELPASMPRPTIRNKMDTLLDTFVKLEAGAYQFMHDIIHNAMIKHVSSLPSSVHKLILRHCSSQFMKDRIHLSGVERRWCMIDKEWCINIRSDAFVDWGLSILKILSEGIGISDQLYNDVSEGRCCIYDLGLLNNPWRDVFNFFSYVGSTDGDAAIAQALAGKSPSDVHTLMCTPGYSLSMRNIPRQTLLHWAIYYKRPLIVDKTLSMISQNKLQQLDGSDLIMCARISGNRDIENCVRQKLHK